MMRLPRASAVYTRRPFAPGDTHLDVPCADKTAAVLTSTAAATAYLMLLGPSFFTRTRT